MPVASIKPPARVPFFRDATPMRGRRGASLVFFGESVVNTVSLGNIGRLGYGWKICVLESMGIDFSAFLGFNRTDWTVRNYFDGSGILPR